MSVNREKETLLTQHALKELLTYDPLTGDFTWVDSTHYKNVIGEKAGSSAHHSGYERIGIAGTKFLTHRLAFLYMEGAWPPEYVDHIDHNRTNNRWANLRHASDTMNAKNCSISAHNTSGVNGVGQCGLRCGRRHKPWKAYIRSNNKMINLGYFATKNEAIAARAAADVLYDFHKNHGEQPSCEQRKIYPK